MHSPHSTTEANDARTVFLICETVAVVIAVHIVVFGYVLAASLPSGFALIMPVALLLGAVVGGTLPVAVAVRSYQRRRTTCADITPATT